MPNPNPIQTEEFKTQQYQRLDAGKDTLSKSPRCIKLPNWVDGLLDRSFETNLDRAVWLRQVIREAVIDQLLPQQQQKARDLLSQGHHRDQVAELTGLSAEVLDSLSAQADNDSI